MLEQLGAGLQRAGLVDLDGTVFFQLGLFVVAFLLLNYLVVQPMIRAQGLRFERMRGARQQAENMDLQAAEALAKYEAMLAEARREAVAVREGVKAEAEDERRKALEAAKAQAEAKQAEARRNRQAQLDQAQAEIEPAADGLADAIVAQILGEAGRRS